MKLVNCRLKPASHSKTVRISAGLTALMLGVSGCSTLGRINPPTPPSSSDVAQSYVDLQSSFNIGTGKGDISATDYVKSGYRKVDQNCDAFFRTLAQAGRNFDFAKREAVLGIATTSSFLALLHNTAQTLSLVATGGAFLADTIDNTEDYVLLTRYTAQLKGIVDQDRALYKANNSPESVAATDKFKADDYIRGYANRCTIETIEGDISQSLSLAKPQISTPTVTFSGAVAQFVQQKLALASTPSDADIARLDVLLHGLNKERAAIVSPDIFASPNKFWDINGMILPEGANVTSLVDLAVKSGETQTTNSGDAATGQPAELPAVLKTLSASDQSKIVDKIGRPTDQLTGQGSSTQIVIKSK